MARQTNRDRVKRIYVARVSGTGWDGQPLTVEFGPYLLPGPAKTMAKREAASRNRHRGFGSSDWASEVLSAPVGEWTREG